MECSDPLDDNYENLENVLLGRGKDKEKGHTQVWKMLGGIKVFLCWDNVLK